MKLSKKLKLIGILFFLLVGVAGWQVADLLFKPEVYELNANR